ncbi:MAG: hypothetical protein IJV24_07120 [Prevotella sp.]|nr:hypothetical protein [Prevotella sp.]
MDQFKAICMSEEFWASSQFSVARYYGHIKVGGHEYVIVNKEGKDIFECSIEAEKAGREKAIEPGEPADLCRRDFMKFYRALGREKFLEVLRQHPNDPEDVLKEIYKEAVKEQKEKEAAK